MNLVKDYQEATKGLQNIGGQIRKNVMGGQRRLRAGKMKTYGAINPFAGTGKAFMSAFKPSKNRYSRITKKKM